MNATIEKIKWVDGDEAEKLRPAAKSHSCAVVTGEGSLHVVMDIDERTVAVYACPGCSNKLVKLVNQFFKPDPKTGDSRWEKATSANAGAKILVTFLQGQA